MRIASELKKIVHVAYPEYKGRKIFANYEGAVTLYNLNWSEGVKSYYVAVARNGKTTSLSASPPWNNPNEGLKIIIPENIVVVEHSYRGMSESVTIYFSIQNQLREKV